MTTRLRDRAPVRRSFWKDTKDICRPTPTPSMTPFSSPTRDDGGRMLDAHPKIFLQGVGIRQATHGAGAAPDRAPVCRGGARQNVVAVGRAKVGTAPAGIDAAGWQTPLVSAGVAAGGVAEESVRRRGALRAESGG